MDLSQTAKVLMAPLPRANQLPLIAQPGALFEWEIKKDHDMDVEVEAVCTRVFVCFVVVLLVTYGSGACSLPCLVSAHKDSLCLLFLDVRLL